MTSMIGTSQIKKWQGEFGKEYTDRHFHSLEEMEQKYVQAYGSSKSQMYQEFIKDLSRDSRILEVGSNVGLQLALLQNMGFRSLYGIEAQLYAVQRSKEYTKDINIIQGDALDIPFKDNYFDMVFTSGLLIHISPRAIDQSLREIYRCARKYILGFECYSETFEEINYRGNPDFCWKRDFAQLFLNRFKDLQLVKKQIYPIKDQDNKDCMYLLEKRS